MLIGHQTHPRKDMPTEITWIGENGFDFADLYFESDRGEKQNIRVREVERAINDYNLRVTGHTAWYLPIGSECEELRKKAVDIIKTYIEMAGELNCPVLTVHANWPSGMFSDFEGVRFQTESLRSLTPFAAGHNVTLVYETLATRRDNLTNIKEILSLNPDLGFHADLGHLNIVSDPLDFLVAFKDRLKHIHMHDNDGHRDLHLPLGAGVINWDSIIKKLKGFYDGTITLEIFSRDKEYVLISKRKLEEKWAAL